MYSPNASLIEHPVKTQFVASLNRFLSVQRQVWSVASQGEFWIAVARHGS